MRPSAARRKIDLGFRCVEAQKTHEALSCFVKLATLESLIFDPPNGCWRKEAAKSEDSINMYYLV